jgi:hypothetical protein
MIRVWAASGTYLQDEVVINILFSHVGVEVGRLDEAEKEFVNNLQVRPREL